MMKAAVITFPGSNCDDDLVYALTKAGFSVDRLWHKDAPALDGYQLIGLPGGFSYGDYLRCGAIAALSPIMQKVKEFANKGGYVFGLCNGFQMLCELGLLPGALARNEGLTFVCKDVFTKVESNESPWTREAKANEVLKLPIAHGDGRFTVDEATYEAMKKKGQILLTYTDERGQSAAGSNPNGSVHAIAGVCNEAKNVFGMMPHPERATDLRSLHGVKFWESIRKSLQERNA